MKKLFFFIGLLSMLILPGCGDALKKRKSHHQLTLGPLYKKRLIKKAEVTLTRIDQTYAFELELANKRCSRKDVRSALQKHVPNRCLGGIGYKIAEYMVGASTKNAPYIFYKMDLDKEEQRLKKLRKQLKKYHADHELVAQLKKYKKKLHSINMAVCHSKEFLTEAYELFAKDK